MTSGHKEKTHKLKKTHKPKKNTQMNLRCPFNLLSLKLVQQGVRKGESLEPGYQVFFCQALFSENDKNYKELKK